MTLTPLVTHGDAYSKLTLTHLSSPNAASDVFEQGKRAYASKIYDDAVDSFTRAIEIIQTDLTIALLHRAAALEMKRDYEGTLQDSLLANPNNKSTVPDPYFTAANALLLQDRLREAALQLYLGTTLVPAISVQYPALVQLRQRVAMEMDARNRWMAKLLPYEILNRILSLLPPKACIRLASTCRFWNNYILREWPGMWSTVIAGDLPFGDLAMRKALESIPQTNVRCVNLDLNNPLWSTQSRMLLDTIRREHWNKIEHLHIDVSHSKDMCDVLRINKDSIKHIELLGSEYFNFHSGITPRDVKETLTYTIATCPNIQSITNHMHGQITLQLQSSSLAVTRLKLLSPPESMRNLHTAKSLIKSYVRTLCVIHDQCPMLQELIVDTTFRDYRITTYSTCASLIAGLTTLKLALSDCDNNKRNRKYRNALEEQVCSIIQGNSGSLRSLALPRFDISFLGKSTLLLNIARIGLPALTDLELSLYNSCLDFGPHDLQHLIAACPALEQARIHGSRIWDFDVLQELSKLICLRQLDIDLGHCIDITSSTSDSMNGLAELVKHSRPLRSFSFSYRCHDIFERTCENRKAHFSVLLQVARSLSSNSKIQKLAFNRVSIVHGDELVSLLDCVKDSGIRTMKISIDRSIEDKHIHAIASLRNLTFLRINCRGGTRIDKGQLIQIFNEHNGGSGQFVVQVIHGRYDGFIGRKQYPVANVNHLDGHGTKDESYFTAYYAITKHDTDDYEELPDRPPTPVMESNENSDYEGSEYEESEYETTDEE